MDVVMGQSGPSPGVERRRQQVPLRHLRQEAKQARRGLVQRLEGRAAPDAMVDAPPPPTEERTESWAVDAARPADMPRPVVFLGPLPLEHGLGPAIADLLFPIGAH